MASSGHTRASVGPTLAAPICPCSRWGLPSRHVAMTLVRSYRTVSAFLPPSHPGGRVFFSVALSVGSRRPAVSWHPALWSPDFPHAPIRDRAAVWPTPWPILAAETTQAPAIGACLLPIRLRSELRGVVPPLCLQLRPGVLQSESAVEHERAIGRVTVGAEVAESFELHGLAYRHVHKRLLDETAL